MQSQRGVLTGAFALVLAATGFCDVPVFSTGVDAFGNQLAGGSIDPHWTVIAGPGITDPVSAVVLNNQLVGTYAQSTDSMWVWVNSSGAGATGSEYTFRLTFDLTGYDHTTAALHGAWGVDNVGYIRLNGQEPIGSGTIGLSDVTTGNFNAFHGFTLTGHFVEGVNTLDFIVSDVGNPGALNVTGLQLDAVPEPGTIAALGLGALLFARRRRK